MDDGLAAMFDRTCDWVAPPIISNGKATVALRRNGERLFLVANYVCNDNYETFYPGDSAMFCSNYKWLGNRLKCIRRPTYGKDEVSKSTPVANVLTYRPFVEPTRYFKVFISEL
uniref:Uncharacterized protein LOC108037084 n=1 Tax=Drosophila rhopaloa TaxID=1041015 RepID=A0A6P4DY59_DRORH